LGLDASPSINTEATASAGGTGTPNGAVGASKVGGENGAAPIGGGTGGAGGVAAGTEVPQFVQKEASASSGAEQLGQFTTYSCQ
jgi:hypothetical protein